MELSVAQLPSPPGLRTRYSWPAVSAALLSVTAAGIHLYVMPEHFAEWWLFGAFFGLVAAAQLLVAGVALWQPRQTLLAAGIALNVGVVVVWVVSRTTGVPLGAPVVDMTAGLADPDRGGYGEHVVGAPEPVGMLDVSATVLELLVVWALLAMLPAASRRRIGNLLLIGGLALWGCYSFWDWS